MIKLHTLDVVKDSRENCYSVMTTMTIKQYLELVDTAYKNRGGIKGQREALKTNTAQRIRRRMIEDLKLGAVLPPVVIGVIVSPEIFGELDDVSMKEFGGLLDNTPSENISIIDGIQRTTALLELQANQDKLMRVEFWVAAQTNNLIYRMLVLNTGQVPWNLRRQVEVVYESLIREFKEKVPNLNPTTVDEKNRRKSAGKFAANELVELFIAFGTRKEKVHIEERLADDFTRLDLIEATSHERFTDMFCEVLRLLVEFDFAFEKYKPDITEEGRFKKGLNLFDGLPAQVGFVTAMAFEVLGRPGSKERSSEEQSSRLETVKIGAEKLLVRLKDMQSQEIGSFLAFDTLNELLARKSGKVGEFEREFFTKAFSTLIEQKFVVEDLNAAWRAY